MVPNTYNIYHYLYIPYTKNSYHKSLPSPIFLMPLRYTSAALGVPNAKTALGVFGDSGGEPQARSDAFFKATTGIHHIKRGIPPHTNVYIYIVLLYVYIHYLHSYVIYISNDIIMITTLIIIIITIIIIINMYIYIYTYSNYE